MNWEWKNMLEKIGKLCFLIFNIDNNITYLMRVRTGFENYMENESHFLDEFQMHERDDRKNVIYAFKGFV